MHPFLEYVAAAADCRQKVKIEQPGRYCMHSQGRLNGAVLATRSRR